jgi:hypothetical protein
MSTDNSDDSIDKIVGYTPPQKVSSKNNSDKINSDKGIAEKKKTVYPDKEEDNNKSQSEILMDLVNENALLHDSKNS